MGVIHVMSMQVTKESYKKQKTKRKIYKYETLMCLLPIKHNGTQTN